MVGYFKVLFKLQKIGFYWILHKYDKTYLVCFYPPHFRCLKNFKKNKAMKKLLIIFAVSILGMVACNEERVEKTMEQEMNAISAPVQKEVWTDAFNECIWSKKQWCDNGCKPCTDPPKILLFENFNSAFTNGSSAIQAFFSSTDISPLWPYFSTHVNLIDGLSTGQKQIVRVTNQSSEIDYYLIGDTNLDDNSIRSNPDYTLSCSECQE